MARYTTSGCHRRHTDLQGAEKKDAYQSHCRHLLHAHSGWLAHLGIRLRTMKAYKFF